MFFDLQLLIYTLPAIVLMLWAQCRIRWAYSNGMQVPAELSGAAAAQHILDAAGVHDVAIEVTPGHLSDHYDPRGKVLRLSPEVYQSRTATAVGIAAHEAGHALQDAKNYAPLAVRNAAVSAAHFGGTAFFVLLIAGMMFRSPALIWLGIGAFGLTCLFQLVNLPVEFDASRRAKQLLGEMGIVNQEGAGAVSSVLNAAAWTYVAATLQSVLTLLYYVVHLGGVGRSDD